MRALISLVVAMWLLSGCVSTTTTSHWSDHGDEIIILVKSGQSGLVLGPCGAGWGKGPVQGQARITLHGHKERYADGEYEIQFPNEALYGHGSDLVLSGVITVDWNQKRFLIALTESRTGQTTTKPCRINGTHSFTDL